MIRDGLVVAYPTDTLYGLAVDPRNAAAVRRLFELKGRPETSALPLIAAEPAHARAAGDLSASADRLAARWWPGALTIVDPSELQFSTMAHVRKNDPVCLIGLKLHLLDHGSTFNLQSREALAAPAIAVRT